MSNQKMKWNTDAEMSLMGHVITVTSDDHLKHLVEYVLTTLKASYPSIDEETAEEVLAEAYKYNEEEVAISHFCVSSTDFGILLTFVRDDELPDYKLESLINPYGVLAYVYNIACPFCSELGYVFFDKRENGKISRVA